MTFHVAAQIETLLQRVHQEVRSIVDANESSESARQLLATVLPQMLEREARLLGSQQLNNLMEHVSSISKLYDYKTQKLLVEQRLRDNLEALPSWGASAFQDLGRNYWLHLVVSLVGLVNFVYLLVARNLQISCAFVMANLCTALVSTMLLIRSLIRLRSFSLTLMIERYIYAQKISMTNYYLERHRQCMIIIERSFSLSGINAEHVKEFQP